MNRKLLLAGCVRMMSRYKLRTFFMSIGVALGVAILVAARALGTGAKQEMMDKVNRMFSPSSIFVRAGGAAQHGGRREGPVQTLKEADLETVAADLEQVIGWDPMFTLPRQEVKVRERSRQVTVYGHSERAASVWNRGVVEGEYFTANDLESAARVALLGTKVAEELFAGESPIGAEIRIGSVPFRVKGLLEPIGIDPHGLDRDEDVQVPVTTVMRRLTNVDYLQAAKLIVDDPRAVEATAERIGEILRQRHSIARGEPDDFAIFTPRFVQAMVGRANRVLDVFLPAAAAIVLLVAAIVIANVMLVAVRERVPEIGLRQAVGATKGQIGLQFVTEAVVVTVASGLAGMALGAAAVAYLTLRMSLTPIVTAESIGWGLAAAIVVGVAAGYLPARQAARLDPVAALR